MKIEKRIEMNLMKSRALTVLFSMLIAALLLLPFFSFAEGGERNLENAKVYMHPLNKDYRAVVTVASVADGKYNLTVESTNGLNVYYDEVMKSPEMFSKIFDFSNLEDGEYTLKIKSNNEEKTRNFTIENGKIKVYYDEKEKPSLDLNGDKATFTVPNTMKLDYSIRVVNERGEELFYTSDNNENIKKVFDFSKVAAGKYQILASSRKANYSFDYEKKSE